MTKHECLTMAAKAQKRLDRMMATNEKRVAALRAKLQARLDPVIEEVEMWLAKAAAKTDTPINFADPPEYRTEDEIRGNA